MKLYITLALVLSSFFLGAQILTFEDNDFLNALIAEGIDSNGDSLIQISEADQILEINIYSKDFESIKGIEGFENLEYLILGDNDLIDTIDLLGLSSLKFIRLSGNPELKSIKVSGHPSIEDISLSGVNGIDDNLRELNISNIPTLKKLNLHNLKVLESFEIYNNDNLEEFRFVTRHITTIDISDLKSLLKLTICGPVTEIISGELPLLEEYYWNIMEPAVLDLTLFPILKRLYIQPQYSNMTNIDISDHPFLEEIYFKIYFHFNSLKLSNLESLNRIWVQSCTDLKTVEFDSLPALNEVYFENYDDIRELSIKNALQLEELNFHADKVRDYTFYNMPMLNELDISSGRIETLDLSTLSSLTMLRLNSSSLEQLYIKNNSNENLFCEDCSSLNFICSDDIDTFENIPSDVYIGSFCPYTSGGNGYEINGSIQYDYGNNGCDSFSIPMPFVSLAVYQSDSIAGLVSSNGTGIYGLYYDQDTFTLRPAENSFNSFFNFIPDSIYAAPNDSIIEKMQDICVEAKQDILNLELVMLDPQETRPGEEAKYKIIARNIGSLVPEGKIILDFEGDYISHVESVPSFSFFDSSRIEWDIPLILPFEEVEIEVTFLLNTPTDEFPLNGDDTLKYNVQAVLESPNIDTIIHNTLCDEVVNSFDPNDKQCMQGNWIEEKSLEDYLYYTIRFENIGTADARNIVIQDTLDSESYITSSFQLVDASHEVSASLDRNVLSFVFEDINLGSDDDENDGHVIFKIKPISDLEIGHEISNDASIYFDYNFPIHTNLAQTEVIEDITISDLDVVNYEDLEFYPSISNNLIHLNNHRLKGDISIVNMNGNLVLKSKVTETSTIDIGTLSLGTYVVRMLHNDKLYIGKLIKI